MEAAVCGHALGTALDLWPIVEDALFGYELVPHREAHTHLIIGCNGRGEIAVRRTSYRAGALGALRLVAVNGLLLSRSDRAARYSIQQRDSVFPDWAAAAESACTQLSILFMGATAAGGIAHDREHRSLEKALGVAHSRLARWDPWIQFFGVPNEAQLGFALIGAGGERGELTFRQPNTWTLHWHARAEVVNESWSMLVDDFDPGARTGFGKLHFSDRRAHRRRATDRGGVAAGWLGKDRRRTRGRRTVDQRNT